MSDDLVQRLRECWDAATGIHYDQEHDLIREAADRIEALEKENSRLLELIRALTVKGTGST